MASQLVRVISSECSLDRMAVQFFFLDGQSLLRGWEKLLEVTAELQHILSPYVIFTALQSVKCLSSPTWGAKGLLGF